MNKILNMDLESLFDQIDEVILCIDSKGEIVYLNSQIKKFLGYNKESFIGKNLFNFLSHENKKNLKSTLNNNILVEKNIDLDLEIKHKRGNYESTNFKAKSFKKGENRLIIGRLKKLNAKEVNINKEIDIAKVYELTLQSLPEAIFILNSENPT